MALTVIITGLLSILMQTLLLRKLLTLFSGNELHLGISLSLWLFFSSIGAVLTLRAKRDILGYLLIISGILFPSIYTAIPLIRALSMTIQGEAIPFLQTLFWTFLVIFPVAGIAGGIFSASLVRWHKGPLIYSLEAFGAFAGGMVFIYLFSGKINSLIVSLLIGFLAVITGSALIKKKEALFLFLLFPFIYLAGLWAQEYQWKPFKHIKTEESRYQEITVLTIDSGYYLYSGGRFFYSYPDFIREERDVHTAMSLLYKPRKVLLIGGNLSTLREFLKYPLERIDIVEIDPLVIKISMELLNKGDRRFIDDKRIKIIIHDPRFFIKRVDDRYDLIILNTPEPLTAFNARFYTIEFFKDLKRILEDRGLVLLRLPQASGYISRPLKRLNGSIYKTLEKTFNFVKPSSEEYGLFIAGNFSVEVAPSVLKERFLESRVTVRYFEPSLFYDIFSPLKVERVERTLRESKEINRDKRPVVYLYNLLFWAYSEAGFIRAFLDISWSGTVFILILIMVTSFFILKRPSGYMIFTTGFVTMAFSIITLLSYQIFYGFLYERIGLLSSLFMLGLAAGSWMGYEKLVSFRGIKPLDAVIAIIFFMSALFISHEISFYFLLFITGATGGFQFSLASNLLKDEASGGRITGKLYAIELSGSFLGALLTTLYMIPHMGILNSFFVLGLIKVLSFVLLLFYEKP